MWKKFSKIFNSPTIIITIIVVLFIGIAIPKLTVHDLVPVDTNLRQIIMNDINYHYDNPFERTALYLGKSRIIAVTPTSAEIESFTVFRIPLGFFSGQHDMKLLISWNPVTL